MPLGKVCTIYASASSECGTTQPAFSLTFARPAVDPYIAAGTAIRPHARCSKRLRLRRVGRRERSHAQSAQQGRVFARGKQLGTIYTRAAERQAQQHLWRYRMPVGDIAQSALVDS